MTSRKNNNRRGLGLGLGRQTTQEDLLGNEISNDELRATQHKIQITSSQPQQIHDRENDPEAAQGLAIKTLYTNYPDPPASKLIPTPAQKEPISAPLDPMTADFAIFST
jgi:hypothetical protein